MVFVAFEGQLGVVAWAMCPEPRTVGAKEAWMPLQIVSLDMKGKRKTCDPSLQAFYSV